MLWIFGAAVLLVDVYYRYSFPMEQLFDPVSRNRHEIDSKLPPGPANPLPETNTALDEKRLAALIDRIKIGSLEESSALLQGMLAGRLNLLNQTERSTTLRSSSEFAEILTTHKPTLSENLEAVDQSETPEIILNSYSA